MSHNKKSMSFEFTTWMRSASAFEAKMARGSKAAQPELPLPVVVESLR